MYVTHGSWLCAVDTDQKLLPPTPHEQQQVKAVARAYLLRRYDQKER